MLVVTIGPQLPCIHAIRESVVVIALLLFGQHFVKCDEFAEQTASVLVGDGHGGIITPLQFTMLELLKERWLEVVN